MNNTWKVSSFAKAVVAFIAGAAVFILGLVTDGDWNLQDTIALIGWIGGTGAVYQTPNQPYYRDPYSPETQTDGS